MIGKIKIGIGIFLLLSFSSIAQPKLIISLDECINIFRADSFYNVRQYDSSLACFRRIVFSGSLLREDRLLYVKMFRCFRDNDQPDSAYHYIHMALEFGLWIGVNAEDTIPRDLHKEYLIFDDARNRKLQALYVRNIMAVKVDHELFKRIRTLINNDQAARRTNYPQNSAARLNEDSLHKAWAQVDSLNNLDVKAIIHQYGWPGLKVLGMDGDNSLWALVQHCDKDVSFQEYVLQLLEAAVLANNTRRFHYAYLYDRICVNRGVPQVFGTQSTGMVNGVVGIHTLADSANVDYYRYAFELYSLERYKRDLEKFNNENR